MLDDFEANLEPRDRGYVLQPEAANVLEALVWAIGDTYAPHRLILTCRYDFESTPFQYFYKQPLEALRGQICEKSVVASLPLMRNLRWMRRYRCRRNGWRMEILGYCNG